MSQSRYRGAPVWFILTIAGCSTPLVQPPTEGAPPPDSRRAQACASDHSADLLFVIDASNTMLENAYIFQRAVGAFFEQVTAGDPATAVTNLHVGVISTDLGTPGSTVPSCADSDVGDDGLLNPIRRGLATRTHQPWTYARPGYRPMRCTMDPDQYPTFLSFEAGVDPTARAEDFACVSFLSFGCGLEQQLESVYRALITQRTVPTSPNQGFLRDDAVLGIFILSDEEDGSIRDCRYAAPGAACAGATTVFDQTSPAWSSVDLNMRFYMYSPGDATDPTWPLERYVDLAHPDRGLLGLKPGRPELVVFGGLLGVPLELPRRADRGVDWGALLGRARDGSDGYVGLSPEGPISMRQRNRDLTCANRVVPSCRRQGSAYDPARPSCDTQTQYFAWPARRIAEVARRFDEGFGNAAVGSICQTDYAETLRAFADRVRARVCH
jgi:hypothetical protein